MSFKFSIFFKMHQSSITMFLRSQSLHISVQRVVSTKFWSLFPSVPTRQRKCRVIYNKKHHRFHVHYHPLPIQFTSFSKKNIVDLLTHMLQRYIYLILCKYLFVLTKPFNPLNSLIHLLNSVQVCISTRQAIQSLKFSIDTLPTI